MKVPTYKRQLQRTDRTGAGMLTAQVNPNVMALAGQGLEQAGQQLFSFGADMLEVETKKQQLAIKSESSIAVQELNTQLKDIRLTVNKMQNPYQAENYWAVESQKVLNRINNNLSKEAQSLFSINGQKLYTDENYEFRLANEAKIPEHMKAIANDERGLILDLVSNPKRTVAERMNGMISIVGGYKKNTDNFSFANPPKNNVGYSRGGDFTEKDKNLLNFHRLNVFNNTVLENPDKSITTVYITGIRNPAEGENSPIYAVPGYYNGKKYSKEEEKDLQEIATEEGWFDVYPSDLDAKSHKKRVNKLHKLIDEDGKNYNKLEKTFQEGLNYNLYKENIVPYEEFKKLNKESLTTITTNILKYLMHDVEDADDVISDVNAGLIIDPIFNSIWENLPIEEKDSIIKQSMETAKSIEDFKDKEIKENDEAYKKQIVDTRRAIFNATTSDDALEAHLYMLSIGGYVDLNEQESALEKIAQLNAKPGDEGAVTFRTSTEDDDGTTVYNLGVADKNDLLTYEMVEKAAKNGLLTKNSYLTWTGKVETEKNDAFEFGNSQFAKEYGYIAEMDMNDDLGKTIKAAFEKSSQKLEIYVEQNKEATYQEIVAKHSEIIQENNQYFKDTLYIARSASIATYNNPGAGLKNIDMTNLTNDEIINAAKSQLASGDISPAIFDVLLKRFSYYQLQQVDKR